MSDRNKMMLWPECESRARCSLHKKNVRSVRFVVKTRGCCCNLSVGVALNVWFTANGMCAKNNTHIYVARTSNNRVIMACDLYCCLLPMCEALLNCRSGFPIATTSQVGATYLKMYGAVLRNQWYLQWLSSSILSEVMVDHKFIRQNFGVRGTE